MLTIYICFSQNDFEVRTEKSINQIQMAIEKKMNILVRCFEDKDFFLTFIQ